MKPTVALGDVNIRMVEPGDDICSALERRGLEAPPHATRMASNITTDAQRYQGSFRLD